MKYGIKTAAQAALLAVGIVMVCPVSYTHLTSMTRCLVIDVFSVMWRITERENQRGRDRIVGGITKGVFLSLIHI